MSALLARGIRRNGLAQLQRHQQHFARAPPTRLVHIRSVSILSGIAKLAGRTAGRTAVGLGVGAGAVSFADMKIEGLRQRTFDLLSDLGTKASDNISAFSEAASQTYTSVSSTAAEAWADTALGIESRFAALRAKLQEAFPGAEESESAEDEKSYNHYSSEPPPPPPPKSTAAAIAAAAAAAASAPISVDAEGPTTPTQDLLVLTKKLIEIRSILLSLGDDSNLTLPSIVVVGSQSSGKSSVLEAIVGREFLPKGDNMVTRRPLELTLVHTPPSASDPNPLTYAEIEGRPGRLTDFEIVQTELKNLNEVVSAAECVSDKPIHLRISSPDVPDLSLVDLPGYVQISSMDQPEELKEKIAGLCDKYIKSPNIVLAVCAANVDLANSPALRASKKVDPLGIRTIGVITKMDLVPPESGAAILSNDRYPLALGYVGVVCKASPQHQQRLLLKSAKDSEDPGAVVRKQESAYFSANGEHFSREGILVGTETLKSRLMRVLEDSMASSLHTISNAVALDLEETSYQFKVQYNDRSISAESYVAETLDGLKARIGQISRGFTKAEVRRMLKSMLDEQVLDLVALQYWNDPKTPELGKLGSESKLSAEDLDLYWQRKLDAISSSLTKSGIGRTSTSRVVDTISHCLETLSNEEPLVHHPDAAGRVMSTANALLGDRYAITSDQVENAVKPFKYEIEVEDKEWETGRSKAVELVQRELNMCEAALGSIRDAVGGRKLRGAMEYVGELEEKERRRRERRREKALGSGGPEDSYDDEDLSDPTRPAYNPALLAKAREAMFLSSRSSVLRLRLMALKSRRCKTGPEQRAFCPEAFLNVVADKLAHTAVQFINIELLVEFFYQFPREIDTRMAYELNRSEVVRFARQNPAIEKHLALQERKEKLELVAEKLDTLVKLQRDKAQNDPLRRKRDRGLFGMF
ncbi:hypothetical protein T439DRAFT_306023 [Meredithblackwellia eburnea MCA 4105]